jgi:hypothetical protein
LPGGKYPTMKVVGGKMEEGREGKVGKVGKRAERRV